MCSHASFLRTSSPPRISDASCLRRHEDTRTNARTIKIFAGYRVVWIEAEHLLLARASAAVDEVPHSALSLPKPWMRLLSRSSCSSPTTSYPCQWARCCNRRPFEPLRPSTICLLRRARP